MLLVILKCPFRVKSTNLTFSFYKSKVYLQRTHYGCTILQLFVPTVWSADLRAPAQQKRHIHGRGDV